jgi:hypothetical protein
MKVSIMNITPVMASEFLANNNSNRKINQKQLDMIIRTILAGKWKLTHQGVAFYSDGELADGQHRLQAIMRTGVSLTMPVFQGIERDEDTVLAIDCGKGRTVTDGASISGIKIKASDVSIAKGLEFGYGDGSFKKLTHLESKDLCEKYSDDLSNISKAFPKQRSFITLAPVKVAAANAIKDGVPIDTVKKFCFALVSGEYNEPIFVNAVRLRSKLISKNYNGGGDRLTAYNMTYNTLIKTSDNIVVKRIVESKILK